MIDFHTHILCEVDDGSRNIRMTEEMLRLEAGMGVQTVALTPHFYAERSSILHFQEKREAALDQVRELQMRSSDLPQLIVGSEVSFFQNMSEADELDVLCFSGSDLMLVEMPFAQWTMSMVEEVRRLIQRRKKTIILAHIERYISYQKDRHPFQEMFELPLYGQCNAGPLQDWRKRRTVLSLFKKGQAQLLGSDCHGLERRVPNLDCGRAMIEKKLGTERLAQMDEVGERLLRETGVRQLGQEEMK